MYGGGVGCVVGTKNYNVIQGLNVIFFYTSLKIFTCNYNWLEGAWNNRRPIGWICCCWFKCWRPKKYKKCCEKILLKLPCYMIKCNCWSGWSCSWGSWREHWLCWLRSHFIDNIAASDKTGVGWLHLTTITIKSEIQIFLFVDSCLPYNIVSSDIIWKCWCWTGWSHLTDKKIKIKIYIYCFLIYLITFWPVMKPGYVGLISLKTK